MRYSVAMTVFVAAVAVSATAVAQQPPADPLVRENVTVKVAAHTYVIPDGNVGLVPNVGIVVGSRGVLVIDPGLGKRNGETVLREVRKVAPTADIYVVATHFHAEHTTGAVAFAPPAKYLSPTVQEEEFAQAGAQQIQTFSGRSPMTAELLRGAAAPRVDVRFERSYLLDLGGVRVRFLVVGPTHTRGDTVMFVEDDDVLFAGDVVMNKSFLAANQASSMKAWLAAFDAVQTWKPTVVVPSHGAVGDGALVQANRIVMLDIQSRARAAKAQGQSVDEAVAAVQRELAARSPEWPRANGIAAAARSAYMEAP